MPTKVQEDLIRFIGSISFNSLGPTLIGMTKDNGPERFNSMFNHLFNLYNDTEELLQIREVYQQLLNSPFSIITKHPGDKKSALSIDDQLKENIQDKIQAIDFKVLRIQADIRRDTLKQFALSFSLHIKDEFEGFQYENDEDENTVNETIRLLLTYEPSKIEKAFEKIKNAAPIIRSKLFKAFSATGKFFIRAAATAAVSEGMKAIVNHLLPRCLNYLILEAPKAVLQIPPYMC